MKDADNILDEVLGVADPVEQELGLNKMFTPTVPRPSKDIDDVDADYKYQREKLLQSNRKRSRCNTGYTECCKRV